ncbi:hypothetical protein NC653_034897 [Populus alba x Populus x berolinensis]|uniref:Uncharacterized protein n=1 Tax=Populus alba x Populus x berolinensis TaxID=444605 RepID=A0AAD6PWS9_9ROSI|nr:hypothetical protein NC653_034897 [Populus alba x Populus x berolinensis]
MGISSRSFTFYGLYTETPTPFPSLSLSLSCLKNQMRRDDDGTGRSLAQATRTHCVSSSGGEIKGPSLYVAGGTRSLHTSECEVPSRFFCSFTKFHA